MIEKQVDGTYAAPPLLALPWLLHSFGTRFTDGWAGSYPCATLRQIHSDRSLVSLGEEGILGEGDAIITRAGGHLVGVKTADCLPVLIADDASQVVGAVHAGWRGTVAGILKKTINRMKNEFGCRPEDLHVAIGPGIQECCFEVGPEVAGLFEPIFPDRPDLGNRTRLDLVEANRRQALSTGVNPDRIYTGAPCTTCRDEFHSYRRDRQLAGRMWSVIGIRA